MENKQTETTKDKKMSAPNAKKKYCLYQDVDVVISSYNRDGKCYCLKCKKKECKQECRAAKSERQRVFSREFIDMSCLCNECLNATIYSEQQRTK